MATSEPGICEPAQFIVPSVNGSGKDHWQSWWLTTNPDARLIRQDDWDRPRLRQWSERAISVIESEPSSILIAHSLGCALVAHLAATAPNLPVSAAVLVAPADVEDSSWANGSLREFAPLPLRLLPFPAVVVASRNDPFVTFQRARHFAERWGAELVDIGRRGHINVESGFGPWPQGMNIARKLVSASPARMAFGKPSSATAIPIAARSPTSTS